MSYACPYQCNGCGVGNQVFAAHIEAKSGLGVDTAVCTSCANHVHHWNLSNGASEHTEYCPPDTRMLCLTASIDVLFVKKGKTTPCAVGYGEAQG